MVKTNAGRKNGASLPPCVRELFWEYGKGEISWKKHRRFIIKRILSHGEWSALKWLRRNTSSEELRKWFVETKGRALDPPRIRFWQLILDLPKEDADRWIQRMNDHRERPAVCSRMNRNPRHRRTGA